MQVAMLVVLASWKDVGGEVNWHAGGDAHGPCILEGCGGRGKLARRWRCLWSLHLGRMWGAR